jgi:hypothetical protein
MTVLSNGYLKSHHSLKQEAPPYRRWGSSRRENVIIGKTNNVVNTVPNQEQAKSADKKMSESIKDIRNIALGVAGVAGVALVAEALGVVSLPAVLPTGAILAGALVSAGALTMIASGVEAAEKALEKK